MVKTPSLLCINLNIRFDLKYCKKSLFLISSIVEKIIRYFSMKVLDLDKTEI